MTNLLFDYDGTLHDSLHLYQPAVQWAYDRLNQLGYAPPRQWTAEEVRSWIGAPPEAFWNEVLPQLPEAERQRSIALVGAQMEALIRSGGAQLYPGVEEVLTALWQAGFRLLLLSNCPRRYLEAHEEAFHLSRHFACLACGEDFQYRPKHQIVPFLQAQFPGPFVVIGDRDQDVEMARCNGLRSIGCRYGYGTPEELAGADWLVDTPQALLTVLCAGAGEG